MNMTLKINNPDGRHDQSDFFQVICLSKQQTKQKIVLQ